MGTCVSHRKPDSLCGRGFWLILLCAEQRVLLGSFSLPQGSQNTSPLSRDHRGPVVTYEALIHTSPSLENSFANLGP